MPPKGRVVICGAGISGLSAAYFLTKAGVQDILVVDERPPLTLTSDRSTECYRNWWPDPALLALMNRSIELLEHLADDSSNCFHLNRRGYLYVTGSQSGRDDLLKASVRVSELGGGPLRIHDGGDATYVRHSIDGFHNQPDGADLFLGQKAISAHFPYLSPDATAALHVRKAGWLSAQQLGMYLLEQAHRAGVTLVTGHVQRVDTAGGRVTGVGLASGDRLECSTFIDAAGPYLRQVGRLLGLELPVYTELHLKAVFKDALAVVPRDAPLLIWNDPQSLPWEPDEHELLDGDADSKWLTGTLPAGAHTRPEGPTDSRTILMLWDYRTRLLDPTFPVPLDEQYPEIALRGLSMMLPGMRAYIGRSARSVVDGGYYVKTAENRLLACPLPIEGAYVLGAVSGYGIMAACGAGELLALHMTGAPLPDYARSFSLERYDDPTYRQTIEDLDRSGQL